LSTEKNERPLGILGGVERLGVIQFGKEPARRLSGYDLAAPKEKKAQSESEAGLQLFWNLFQGLE